MTVLCLPDPMRAGGADLNHSNQFHPIMPPRIRIAREKCIIPIRVQFVAELSTCPRDDRRAVGTPGPTVQSNDRQGGRRSRCLAGHEGSVLGSHHSRLPARLGPYASEISAGKQLSCNQVACFRRGIGPAMLFTILNQSLAKEIEEPTFMSMQRRP
jgi:hypothetical protein